MGQLPSATNPARIRAETRDSQASGYLWANTITKRPSGCSVEWQARNALNIPSSYIARDCSLLTPRRLGLSISSPSFFLVSHFGERGVEDAASIAGEIPCRILRSQT